MIVKVVSKSKIVFYVKCFTLTVVAILLLLFPSGIATGVSRGLSLCSSVLLPTLFPFLLFTAVATNLVITSEPSAPADSIMRKLFGLPGEALTVLLLGFIGGYPSGGMAIARLERAGVLTPAQAKRMTYFCINAGPGFLIGTVGTGLLGSRKAGVLLTVAHLGASLIIGLLLAPQNRRDLSPARLSVSLPGTTENAVAQACRSMLILCGYVITAVAVLSLAEVMQLPIRLAKITGTSYRLWRIVLAFLIEVSNGCITIAQSGINPVIPLSLCVSFGGLAVFGQLKGIMGETFRLDTAFLLSRLIHGLLAAAMSFGLFLLFPVEIGAMAQGTAVTPFAVSGKATVMLLILSFTAFTVFSEKKVKS